MLIITYGECHIKALFAEWHMLRVAMLSVVAPLGLMDRLHLRISRAISH
jgi:hypothetical protein